MKKLVGNFTAYTESGTNVDSTKLEPSSLMKINKHIPKLVTKNLIR